MKISFTPVGSTSRGYVSLLSLSLLVALVAGCGGGGSSSPSPTPSPSPSVSSSPSPSPSPTPSPIPAPTVSLAADSADLLRGQSTRLFWESGNAEAVVESNFEAATTAGEKTITPLETTVYTLNVRNSVGVTATARFEVRVASVGVTIAPSSQAITDVSASLPFAVQVTGAVDTGVSWTVQEDNGGSINEQGVYTAPATAGVYHVQATSKADPGKSAVVEVRVRAASGTVNVN